MKAGTVTSRSGLQQECYGNIPRNQRARNFNYRKHISAISRAELSRYPSCRQVCLLGCAALVLTSSVPVASSSLIRGASGASRVPDVFLNGLLHRSITATFPENANCSVNSFCWAPQHQSSSNALLVSYDCQLQNRVNKEFQCITFRRMPFLNSSQRTGCVNASDDWDLQAAQNRLQRDPAARAQLFLRTAILGRRTMDEGLPLLGVGGVERQSVGQSGMARHPHHNGRPQVDQTPLDEDLLASTWFNNDPFGPPIIFEPNLADEAPPQESPTTTTKRRRKRTTTTKRPRVQRNKP